MVKSFAQLKAKLQPDIPWILRMSILDGMTRVYPERSIFIVVRKNTIILSKAAYEGLGKPDAVEIYVGGGKAALKPGDGFKFATVEPGKQNMYRISGVNMVRQVKEQVGEGRVMGRIVDRILVVG